MGVSDDQLHALESTGLQAAQERRPEGTVPAVAHSEAEHLAAAVPAHPSGHDHRLGDHPTIDSGLVVGRVDEDIREDLAGQRAVPEGADLGVQVGADPRDLDLAGPAVGTQRADQVVDLAGGDPVQVGLHHHREQGLVDPAAPLQQAGEERPRPQLRDVQLQIPGRRAQYAGTMAVALGQSLGVRWWGAAPIACVSSASIKAW